MSSSEFQKCLNRISFLFRMTGMSISGKNARKIERLRDRAVFMFNFAWLNSDVVCGILWLIDQASITEVTYILPCSTLGFVATFKSFIHLFNEDKIFTLIEIIKKMEEDTIGQAIDGGKERKKEIRFLNIVTNVLNMFNVMMVVGFAATPLLIMLMKYLATGEVELIMPFMDLYPFNAYDLRWYPFMFFHQIWSESIALLQICAADFLHFTCCTFIRIQFQLLRSTIEEVIPQRPSFEMPTEEYSLKIGKIVTRHQQLIRATEILETVYTISTLFNFISSSVIICLTGFNVTTIDDPAFVGVFMTFLFMSLLQVFFLCFFGDLLTQSSVDVSSAVYNCRWYAADVSIARDLGIILTRAQKPCKLTALGFADVDLKAYMTILSRSWSYFALLKTVYR